jgi:hypothetical protein
MELVWEKNDKFRFPAGMYKYRIPFQDYNYRFYGIGVGKE